MDKQKVIMKHIPILFSTPMVQAILDGRKTMTRRVVKDKHVIFDRHSEFPPELDESEMLKICPYGKPGDILWVRETWVRHNRSKFRQMYTYCSGDLFIKYKADGKNQYDTGEVVKWKSPYHMPKSACRIFLEVVSVRVERLQEINQEDAKAEGITPIGHRPASEGCTQHADNSLMRDCYKCAFKVLWNKINGKSGSTWDRNEWVWVIEFKRVAKPIVFSNESLKESI